MKVLDASVVVELLLGTERGVRGGELLLEDPRGLAAPHLIDVEVGSVLRRLVLSGQLTATDATLALHDLEGLPLIRYLHTPLLGRAHELRDNVTTYDAMYVALAEVLEASLLTTDQALRRVPGCEVEVVVI